jgi:hypothetical protein
VVIFLNKKQNYDFRICLVRQPRERPRGDPGHERVPGWSQTTQGSTQTIQRLRKTILTFKVQLKRSRDFGKPYYRFKFNANDQDTLKNLTNVHF